MRCSSRGGGLLEQHGTQIRLRRSQGETWSRFGEPGWARLGELALGPLWRAGYSGSWQGWDRLAELRVGLIPRAMTGGRSSMRFLPQRRGGPQPPPPEAEAERTARLSVVDAASSSKLRRRMERLDPRRDSAPRPKRSIHDDQGRSSRRDNDATSDEQKLPRSPHAHLRQLLGQTGLDWGEAPPPKRDAVNGSGLGSIDNINFINSRIGAHNPEKGAPDDHRVHDTRTRSERG